MFRKPMKAAIAVLAVLAMVATACQTTGDADAEGEFDLKIGVLTSFTGRLADFGEPIHRAVELAKEVMDETIEELDLNITVEIIAEDDETTTTAGVEAARKLVETDGVSVIIGPLASSVTVPVAESVAVPGGVILITPASTAGALTTLEDDNLVFRTVPSDILQSELIARTMADLFGAEATISTGGADEPYADGLLDGFEAAWEREGGTIGNSVRWPDEPPPATYDSEAGGLVEGSPDGWLIVPFPEDWQKLGAALSRTGQWDITKTFTADGLKSTSLPNDSGAALTVGMRGSAPGSGSSPAAEAFDALWTERAGIERQTFDSNAFDAAMVAFLAAVAAGSSDPARMQAEMQNVAAPGGTQYTFENLTDAVQALLDGEDIDYEGASGQVNLDDNGDPVPEGAQYEIWVFQCPGEAAECADDEVVIEVLETVPAGDLVT